MKDIYQMSSFFGIKWESFLEMINNGDDYYRVFYIKQKNGKRRKITSPNLILKRVQKIILDTILVKHQPLKFVFGFYTEKNHILNARQHLMSKYQINIDISDFFGSINSKQVYFVFNKLYNFDNKISTALTHLTTHNGSLPQGAPTSPMLSNLVFRNLDYRIRKFSDKMGIIYTRYADDLTFSSDKIFNRGYVLNIIRAILSSNGFQINSKKTIFKQNHLNVNGLNIIDKRILVSSKYKRDILQQVYYIRKYGIEDHLNTKYSTFEKDAITYLSELLGKINYVRQVEGFEIFNEEITYLENVLSSL
jgi:RNA-directed DNA polymerase